jgi:Leucine-rich repeat (LRR) protein
MNRKGISFFIPIAIGIHFSFFILPFAGHSQLVDSLSLDTMQGCASMKEALALPPDQVIKLVLSKKKLKEFPEEIRKFTNLQYLDLSKNSIKEVPQWIGELKSLQEIILSRTKIETLPSEFGSLTHLKYFIMNRSALQSLPTQIGYLTELESMDLWDDNLSSFPPELKKLKDNLKILDLRDVLVPDQVQAALKSYLPNTTIYFSPTCPCEK